MSLLKKNGPVSSITVVGLLLISIWVGVLIFIPDEIIIVEGTDHSGIITVSEIWSPANNPHNIVNDLRINNSATITILPGVLIKVTDSKTIQLEEGTLIANGTASNPIILTSNSSTPVKGSWDGIEFSSFNSNNYVYLSHCFINYSNIGINCDDYIDIIISESHFLNSNTGISISSGSPRINNTLISKSTTGISISSTSSPVIYNNTLNETTTSILISGTGLLNIYNNTINDTTTGISISGIGSTNIYNNTLTDTSTGISITGSGSSDIYDNSINFSTTGISITAGTSNIINNNITNCSTGISISSNALPKVWTNTIYNSTTAGISISSSGSPEIYLNNISNSSIGIEIAGSTAKIHHNDIYLCQEGAYLNSNTGFTFYNNSMNSCDYSISSRRNAVIDNCSIVNSTIKDFTLSTPVHIITTLNTSFPDNVSVATGCTLYKKFYLDVKVQDNFNLPVGGATVTVMDNMMASMSYTTKPSGWARWLRCTEKVFTNAGMVARTPHSISATKNGYDTASSPVNMDQNRELTLTIEDIMAPTSITNTANYWYNTQMINLNYTVNDNSELTNIKLYYNFSSDNITFTITDVEVNSSSISGGTALGNFNFEFSDGEGYYGLYTRATDKNSQVEDIPTETDTKVGYDIKPPRIIGSSATNITEDSELEPCSVFLTLNDTLSGVGGHPELRYKYDSTSPTWNSSFLEMTESSRSSRGEIVFSIDIPAPFDTWNQYDGDYLAWEIRCKDKAGNENISIMSSATKEYIDYVDHAPTINVNLPSNKWYNHTIYVSVNADDSDSDFNDPNYGIALVEAEYSIDSTNGVNGTWANISVPDTSDPFEFYWSTDGKVGTDELVWVRARSKDLGGLYSGWNAVMIKIDNEPGVSTHDYIDYWHNSDFEINLTASDISALGINGSGVREIWYKINNGTSLLAYPASHNEYAGLPEITTEGVNNTLEYWSIDNQSNVERHLLLYDIKLDKTKPIMEDIKITDITEYTTQEDEVQLFVNVTEPLSGLQVEPKFRVKFENSFEDWQNMVFVDGKRYRGIIELPLNKVWFQYADKDIEVEIQCIDKANNMATKSITEFVDKIELYPPEIEHEPVTTGLVDETITISARVTDNEQVTEVHLFYKAIGGTTFTSISMLKEEATDIYSSSIPPQAKLGSVYYYIRAKDNNNNVVQKPEVNPQLFPYEIKLVYKDLDGDKLPDWWEIQHFEDISKYGAQDDPDKDELDNLAEYENSTDPNKFDTDGDKMPDGWEIRHGLDPNSAVGNDGGDADPDGDGFSNYKEYKGDTDPFNGDDYPKEDAARDYTAMYIGIIAIIVIVILLLTFFMLRSRSLAEELIVTEELAPDSDLDAEPELEEVEAEDMEEIEAQELDLIKPDVTAIPVDGEPEKLALAEAEACSLCGQEIEPEGMAVVCPCGVTVHETCVAEDNVRECPQCGKVFDFETLGIKVAESIPTKVAKPAIKSEKKQKIEELVTPPESAFFAYIPKKNNGKETHDFLQGYYKTHKLGKSKLNKNIEKNVSLFISDEAAKAMLDHSFEHGREKEVMGLILGTTYFYKDKRVSIAKDVATSEVDSTEVEVRFKNFEELFAKLETLNYDYQILGWYHTHPGHTCFMSPTDIKTQKRMFKYDYQHGVIIDPVNLDIKAYTLDPKSDEKAIERGFAIIKYKDTF